jgi:glutaconyl-CoA decarboxylase
MKYTISIEQKTYEVEVGAVTGGLARVSVDGTPYRVKMEKTGGEAPAPAVKPVSGPAVVPPPAPKPAAAAAAGTGTIAAPIPGLIQEITVKVGDTVRAGQVVVVMEAMKMENRLITTVGGTVKEILLLKGAHVSTGDVIMIIA